MTTNNDEVVKVKLLIEVCKDDEGKLCWYQVTSMDEYGVVCRKRAPGKDAAIEKCKKDTEDMLDGPCEYTMEELEGGDESN